MGEKNLWSKVGLITLLVGLSIWQIWPPREKLKPGIDLGGGYSALFEIDDTNAKADAHLAEKVMEILKQRIDPGSTRNLVWRPVGRNRLEIQMPRQTGDTSARDNYERIRKELLATNITESQVRAALALAPAQRDAKFAQMVEGVGSRRPLFDELAKLDDQYRGLNQTAESQPATTRPASSQPAASQPALAATTRPGQDLGALLEKRQDTIADLLKTNLNVPALLDRLELGNSPKRASEIEQVKQQHPALADKIDKLVGAYDEWSKHKGVLSDPSDLLRLLRGAGVLEFRILATRNPSNPDMLQAPDTDYSRQHGLNYNEPVQRYVDELTRRGPRPEAGDNYAWFKVAKPKENSILSKDMERVYVTGKYLDTDYVLAHATPDMCMLNDKAWTLVDAQPDRDRTTGQLAVAFQLDQRGGDKFAALTSTNIHRPLAIFLDNDAISAANIRDTISTHCQITGHFTQQDVNYLVQTLQAGALPARLKDVPIQERNVGPSLGQTNINKGLIATFASLVAVMAFMIIYYHYNGAIANVALLMNLIITLGAMSFIGATFTLPGIAGLILTLGMAVDANVLIFERVREELSRGVSAKMAVKLGYERAFSAIFDGHVTSILTAAILYWIGSEEIKGFGLTLGLGLALSLFTALWVTRQYYYVMIPLTLNREEVQRTWLVPGVLAILGGLLVALGYAFNRPVGLGRFLAIVGLTGLVMVASMWVFRIMYKTLGHQKANRLPMMKLLAKPQIDWMTKYKKFWILSGVIIGCGLIFMAIIPKDQVMDIEFMGGTDVEVQLKPNVKLSDEQVRERIEGGKQVTSVGWLRDAADQLRQATVKPADETKPGEFKYVVSMPRKMTAAQLQALLLADTKDLTPYILRNGVTPAPGGVAVQFDPQKKEFADAASVERTIRQRTSERISEAANNMSQARVQSVSESGRAAFDIVTTETARSLVAESLLASMQDILEVKTPVEYSLVKDPERAPDGIFPINRNANVLSDVIGGPDREDIAKYKGGLVMVLDNLKPAETAEEVQTRIRQMRMQPEFESTGWREPLVIPLEAAPNSDGKHFTRMAVVVVDSNQVYDEDRPAENATWRAQVAVPELKLTEAALASSSAMQRVTQFAPQVASEASQKAVIAVILSFIAIAGYLWLRFGSLDFGLSGIIALYHDVMVALAGLLACHYLHGTFIGKMLMLRDFKIDLTVIAALLTIVGYSITDSIVIFDRIRENRGRLGQISATLVNDSINQTLSRTVLTVFTVFLVVLIMYVAGGEGIHAFAFAMLIGSITGVYSTIAVATPMVIHPRIMWGVTIFITAVTMIGITASIQHPVLRWALVLIVVAGAVYLAYRQYAAHREEQAALPGAGRQPATA